MNPSDSFSSLEEFADEHAALLDELDKWCESKSESVDSEAESSFVLAHRAKIAKFLSRGAATGKLLHGLQERSPAQRMLDKWATSAYRAGAKELSDVTLADFDENAAPDLTDKLCPYVGLDTFSETDSDRFFGREDRLKDLLSLVSERRMVFVTGASGSGKSSLILAGLIPQLKKNALPGSAKWKYLPTVLPGPRPLESLAKALAASVSSEQRDDLVGRLSADPGQLLQLLGQDLAIPSLLVVDQFEEVFTLRTAESAEQSCAFIAALLALASDPKGEQRVVLTFRKDREEDLASDAALQKCYFERPFIVSSMRPEQLRDVIEKPAKRVGLIIDKDVVDELVATFTGDEAGLPLLQFCLVELWQRRSRNRILLKTLKELGDPKFAMGKVADEIYTTLIPEARAATKQLFLFLSHKGEGQEFLRARKTRGELWNMVGNRETVDRVLERFLERRLVKLTPSATGDKKDDVLEVAHEALLRNWLQFREWTVEEGERIEKRRFITSQASLWAAKKSTQSTSVVDLDTTGLLLSGIALKEAMTSVYDDFPESSVERGFLDASNKNAQEVDSKLLRAAESARMEAKWAGDRLRGRNTILGLCAVIIVSIAAAVYFLLDRNSQLDRANVDLQREKRELSQAKDDIEKKDRELVGLRFAERAVQQCESDPERAARYVSRVLGMGPQGATESNQEALGNGVRAAYCLMRTPLRTVRDLPISRRKEDLATTIALAPDGSKLATASRSGKIVEWDLSDENFKSRPLDEAATKDKKYSQLTYDASGTYLLAAYEPSNGKKQGSASGVDLWSRAKSDQLVPVVSRDIGYVLHLAFSRDGSHIATVTTHGKASDEERLRVWKRGALQEPVFTKSLGKQSVFELAVGESDADAKTFTVLTEDRDDFQRNVFQVKPTGRKYVSAFLGRVPECEETHHVFAAGTKRVVHHLAADCSFESIGRGRFVERDLPGGPIGFNSNVLDVALRGHGTLMLSLLNAHDDRADIVIRPLRDDVEPTVLPGAFDMAKDEGWCDDTEAIDCAFSIAYPMRRVQVSDDGKTIAVKRSDGAVALHKILGQEGVGWSSRIFGSAFLTQNEKYLGVLQEGANQESVGRRRSGNQLRAYVFQLREIKLGKAPPRHSFKYSGDGLLSLQWVSNAGDRFLTYDEDSKKAQVWLLKQEGGIVPETEIESIRRPIVRPETGAFAVVTEMDGQRVWSCYKLEALGSPVPAGGNCRLSTDGKAAGVLQHSKEGSVVRVYDITGTKPQEKGSKEERRNTLLFITGTDPEVLFTFNPSARSEDVGTITVSELQNQGLVEIGMYDVSAVPRIAVNEEHGLILTEERVWRNDGGYDTRVTARLASRPSEIAWTKANVSIADAHGRYLLQYEAGEDRLAIIATPAQVDSQEPVLQLNGWHRLFFSIDGKWLAAMSSNRTVIYELESKFGPNRVFVDLPFAGDSAWFSPSGDYLVIRSNRRVDVLPLRPDRLREIIESTRVKLELSDDEMCDIERDHNACERIKSRAKK